MLKKFLRIVFVLPWRTLGWLRAALANLLMLVVVIVLGASFIGHEGKLPDEAVLLVEPGHAIVEQRTYGNPVDSLMQSREEEPAETVLREMTSAIRWAANDNHVKAIVIKPGLLEGSDLGKLTSVAEAIRQFKTSGKPVIAVGDNYSQAQYFLASTADRIYMNPMGSVQVFGFGAYQSYMKDLLDKLLVNVHVFRAGQFKSFIEPFVRNDMSPEARENLQQWMNEQWHAYSNAIEERRHLEPGSLTEFINKQDSLLAAHANNAAALALDFGLVDELASRSETDDKIDELTDADHAETISVENYFAHIQSRQATSKLLDKKPRIAIIHASGEIMDGHQPPGTVGAETLIDQIKTAREDDQVAAIVLRIDSPGGSAFASELIRSELVAAQAAGKPVVASMGGVAASGGYWIAASADEIWASPTTITGSIGVFGVIPTFENTLSRIGAHSDGYSTTALADAMQVDRPMSELTARVMQQGVDFTYQQFLQLVSHGRNTTPQAIDAIAQGRVWTGAHAKELHLVDHTGELDDAIAAAARLAKLKDYQPDYMEPELSPFETLLQDFSASSLLPAQWRAALATLAKLPAMKALADLQMLNDPNHIYVQCWQCRASIR
ncbi:MAG TPA: signal peptide peptidase SppA [Pseudomonadales bacterium]|nr:signal peptide peptidase SppA [Pseudomonadales bacterium]